MRSAQSRALKSPAENNPASARSSPDRFPASELPDGELSELIRSWQLLLQGWADNGRLSRAAQIALNLPADHPGLVDFVGKIAAGDFSELPTILALDWEAMEGSACAYAPEQRLILINKEWLENAVAEQVHAVLTDELGHHLDVLFNPVDTPGDEGELFLECLRAGDPSEDTRTIFRNEESTGVVHLHGETIAVEEAGVGAFCLDLRDLPHPSESPPA
jgi:hypothetical protein